MSVDSSNRSNNEIIVVLCVGCYDVKMEARRLISNAPRNRVVFVLIFTYIIIEQFVIKLYDERIINK